MGKNFYAVRVGAIPGIYTDWEEAKKQINGFPNQQYKGFETEEEAVKYLYNLEGKYNHLEKLGEGGFAEVYKILDSTKPIVIKILKKDLLEDQGAVSRFHREYEITKSLSDLPGVVNVYDFTETDISYSMEYLDTTLANFIYQKKDSLELSEQLDIIRKILLIITQVHERSIIHRDITPRNIFLNNGQIVLADFGLGKDLNSLSSHETMYTRNFGVYDYCSPEQYQQLKDATKQSDIYSLGKVINYIMTGSPRDKNHIFKSVVEICTTSDPDRRYIDCEAILDNINQIYEFSQKKDAESVVDLNLRNGNLTVYVQDYLQKVSGEDLCQKLNDKNYLNFNNLLIQYMYISKNNGEEIINKIAKSFKGYCGNSFASYDAFATFARQIIDEDFSQVIKNISISILNYVAWGVNRFYAQDLVRNLIDSNQNATQFITLQKLKSKSWDEFD